MVRYKPVPEPCGIDRLREVHDAVPTDPEDTDDCCARLCTVGPLSERAAAQVWLPFLVALGLASCTDAGYHRLDWQGRAHLAERFRENVLGSRELYTVLDAEGPLSLERLLEEPAIRTVTPRTDAENADTDEQSATESRVRRLLGWSEQFGVIVQEDGAYSIAEQNAER